MRLGWSRQQFKFQLKIQYCAWRLSKAHRCVPTLCSRARESDPGQQAAVTETMQPGIERIVVNKAGGIVKLAEALDKTNWIG